MTPEARAALQAAITDKWEPLARGEGEDNGPLNCALCKLFYYRFGGCLGIGGEEACPVAKNTKVSACKGTPYEDWNLHYIDLHSGWEAGALTPQCPKCNEIAQEEVDFLRGLLEEGP